MSSAPKTAGFTLIELMLAMALFSLGLLVVAAGFLSLLHLYQNGVVSRATQHDSRFGINQILTDSHDARGYIVTHGASDIVCMIGAEKGYYVNGNRLVVGTWSSASPCLAANIAATQPISSANNAILNFTADEGPAKGVCSGSCNVRITLRVASATASANVTGNQCDPSKPNLTFCSVTVVSTTLVTRGVVAP